MKTPKIAQSMNHLDDDLITEATREEKQDLKTAPFLKWGSLAACFCVLIMAAIMILPNLRPDDTPLQSQNPVYKTIQTENSAIVWPWEYKAIYEKYLFLSCDGKEYDARGKEIRAELLGEALGEGKQRDMTFTRKSYMRKALPFTASTVYPRNI